MEENNDTKSFNNEIKTSGWDAINKLCDEIYPDQKDPKHYTINLPAYLGGKDIVEGISVYDAGDYWHFVTYGLTELYDKESTNKDISGYGMEFTFKLKKDNYEDEEKEIVNICDMLVSLARSTYQKGEIFNDFEYVYTHQTYGIDYSKKSNITGLITVSDTKFHDIDTLNGRVHFVEFVGATDSELKAVFESKITVKELYEKIGSDITDYNRKSVI